MVKDYLVATEAEAQLEQGIKKQIDWGFIVTTLGVASVFLGNSIITINLGLFQLYPLRLFGFIGFFFMVMYRKWQDPFLNFTSNFLFFWMILGLISVAWAPDPALAIKEFGILQTGITFTWLLAKYVNTEERFELVLLIWVCGAILVNMIGLWEVITQKHLIVTKVSAALERDFERIGAMAPRSTFGNHNNYGFFNAITSLVLLGMFIKKVRSTPIYILNGISLALSLYLLVSTYSRAAIGAFVLGAGCFVIFTFFYKNKHTASVIKLVVAGVVAVALLIAVKPSLVSAFGDKLYLVVEKNEQRGEDVRSVFIAESLDYVSSNLGIGMGPGAAYSHLDGIPPHNFFVQTLVDYGVVIVLALLWVFFRVFRRFGLYRKVMPDAMPHMLKASLIAFPLAAVGPSSIMGEGIFWLWFGVIIAYSSIMLRKYCDVKSEAPIAN